MRLQGLTKDEVELRRKNFGFNKIPEAHRDSLAKLFLAQFDNLFVYLLFVASFISFLVGESFEGLLILLVLIGNAVFGFFQEWKADKSLEELKKMIEVRTKVIREGILQEIDMQELVPEDIVFLEAGDIVPADGVVLEAKHVSVNEAVLTGESLPVSKDKGDNLYMGTSILDGIVYMKVTAIGLDTKFGKIARHLDLIEKETPLLKKKVRQLSLKIGVLGVLVSSFVILFTLLIKDYSLLEAFLLASSLAVAVVPEGLPLILTSVLAVGVRKMADKKSIVRRLSSIEALGNVNLILTDKTGTLTANKLEVKGLFDAKGKRMGKIAVDDLLALNIALCASAKISRKAGKYEETGDPVEIALLRFLSDQKIFQDAILNDWDYIDIKPFNSKDKKMWVKVKRRKDNKVFEFTKGAVEIILRNTSKRLSTKGKIIKFSDKDETLEVVRQYMRQGFKVLGFSFVYKGDDVFLGFGILYDPPRKEAKSAVERARYFGVDTVMVTGDSREAGFYVAKEVGIAEKEDEVLEGSEIEGLSDYQLTKLIKKIKVFARVDPLQKQRIVKIYKKEGYQVAVTGDGVNDVAAIKQADVGIAMGSGTLVTKQASDLIILDDNYATIVKAISEGRKIIWNLKKSVKFLLSCNVLEILVILFSLFYFSMRIFTPAQILFINLVTDSIPAFAFVFVIPAIKVLRKKITDFSLVSRRDLIDIILWTAIGTIIFILFTSVVEESYIRSFAFVLIVYLQVSIFLFLLLQAVSPKSIFKNKWIMMGLFFPLLIQYVIVNFFPSIFRLIKLDLFLWLVSVLAVFIFIMVLYLVSRVNILFLIRQDRK